MPRVLHSGEGADWGSGHECGRKIQQATCPQQSEITGATLTEGMGRGRAGPHSPAWSWDPANTSHAAVLPPPINGNQVHEVTPAICHFHTLNGATWRLILACTSCTVKLSWSEEMGRKSVPVFVHTHVVPAIFWWFTQFSGSRPGPIFSFSLRNSKPYHWSCCPVLSLFPLPAPVFLTLPFFTFPQSDIQLGVRDATVYQWTPDMLFCHLRDREVSPQTTESRFKT